MLVEAPRYFFVDRVEAQREISGQHGRRVALRRIVRIRHGTGAGAILRAPLMGAGRALRQLPLVAEQVLEEVVAPPSRRSGPGHFQAARDGVTTLTRAEPAGPAEAPRHDIGAFRLRAHERGIARTVSLAEAVTAGDKCHRFLVIHRHAAEGLADVAGSRERIGLAVRALGIDVDAAPLHSAERPLEIAAGTVALIRQPLPLRAPV